MGGVGLFGGGGQAFALLELLLCGLEFAAGGLEALGVVAALLLPVFQSSGTI